MVVARGRMQAGRPDRRRRPRGPKPPGPGQPRAGLQDRSRLPGPRLEFDDLIGEGNLGLIRGAEEFDPRFGTRFGTYACYWIKESIRHALITTTSTIRLPAHMVRLLTKWRRAERSLYRESGRAPNFDEIASLLRLTESQKTMMAKAHRARRVTLGGPATGEARHWSPDGAIRRTTPDVDARSR